MRILISTVTQVPIKKTKPFYLHLPSGAKKQRFRGSKVKPGSSRTVQEKKRNGMKVPIKSSEQFHEERLHLERREFDGKAGRGAFREQFQSRIVLEGALESIAAGDGPDWEIQGHLSRAMTAEGLVQADDKGSVVLLAWFDCVDHDGWGGYRQPGRSFLPANSTSNK